MTFALIVLGFVVVLGVWWRYFRIDRPEMPPLSLPADDPLILEATRKARESMGRFRALLREPHKTAHAKVRFVSSSNEVEYLWSECRALRETEIEVFYTTPPVTHSGRLERLHTHPLGDLVDWQIERSDGLYEGGFSMLVMFERAREQWGGLPPELEALERRYRTGHTP